MRHTLSLMTLGFLLTTQSAFAWPYCHICPSHCCPDDAILFQKADSTSADQKIEFNLDNHLNERAQSNTAGGELEQQPEKNTELCNEFPNSIYCYVPICTATTVGFCINPQLDKPRAEVNKSWCGACRIPSAHPWCCG